MTSYVPIADYALIGDCHGAALVSRGGAIDWACLTRFDGDPVFCRILDAQRGGTFRIAPTEPFTSTRRYLPGTNVLETTFETDSGVVRLVDCFAMRRGGSLRPYRQLLRRVEGVRGRVELAVLITPRFDYAQLHPWLRAHGPHLYSAVGGDGALVVTSGAPLEHAIEPVAWEASFSVGRGEKARFTVTAASPHDLVPRSVPSRTFDARLESTRKWWARWTQKGRGSGATDPAVQRSALVLKLLTCAPTGAIVAAPTTSLPEAIGGPRNWDYRYTWIRDATMTLAALLATGHPEAATGFKRFIEIATAGRPEELQIMYGCYGARRLTEIELPHLDGYRGSRPVRIGNGAATQTQLDVYGELLDAAHLWRRAGATTTPEGWAFLRGLVDTACVRWVEPDHGLWEMRGAKRHFVYSKVMCWAAVNRGIELAEEEGLECDLQRWRETRDAIRADVFAKGLDPVRGCFVMDYGNSELDASLLRLPQLGFVEASDHHMQATITAIQEDLSVGPLIRRYRTEARKDSDLGHEGTFLMTTFWLVDVLAMAHRHEEAEALYEAVMALANDVGLFAEQYDVAAGIQLGNFPQAFTHIAQINAAEQIRRCREGHAAEEAVADRAGAPRRPHATLHHAGVAHERRRRR